MDAILETTTVQDRVGALRARIAESRDKSQALRGAFQRPEASTSLPPGVSDVIGTLRKFAFSDASDTTSPNPGLPMMAGVPQTSK